MHTSTPRAISINIHLSQAYDAMEKKRLDAFEKAAEELKAQKGIDHTTLDRLIQHIEVDSAYQKGHRMSKVLSLFAPSSAKTPSPFYSAETPKDDIAKYWLEGIKKGGFILAEEKNIVYRLALQLQPSLKIDTKEDGISKMFAKLEQNQTHALIAQCGPAPTKPTLSQAIKDTLFGITQPIHIKNVLRLLASSLEIAPAPPLPIMSARPETSAEQKETSTKPTPSRNITNSSVSIDSTPETPRPAMPHYYATPSAWRALAGRRNSPQSRVANGFIVCQAEVSLPSGATMPTMFTVQRKLEEEDLTDGPR